MKESKYLYDSWFDDLYEDLNWEHTCKEQENYNKAVDLAKSLSITEEEEQRKTPSKTPNEIQNLFPSRKRKRK